MNERSSCGSTERTSLRRCLPVALCLLIPSLLTADENGAGDSLVLEEITVTARRAEVALAEATTSVAVVSGEAFGDHGIEQLDRLNGWAPGLMVSRNDGAGRVASIRGVGWETAQNLSTQPSVLLYLDGVYVANPLAYGLFLGELERIEIFRGPQGTEFGQGTTGGAINLVTRRPEGSFGGAARLELGNYRHRQGSVAFEAPLGEEAAVRLAGRRLVRDGFARIEGGALDGYQLDDADAWSGHLAADWAPTASTSVRLTAFSHRSDQHGAAQKSRLDPNPDPRRLTQDYPSSFALDNDSLSVVAEWRASSGVTLRSLTGVQRLRKRQSVDGDRLTQDLVAIDLTGFGPAAFDVLPFWDNDSDAVSQEVVLFGSGERGEWRLGGYYLLHENRNFFLEAIGPAPFEQFRERIENPSPETLPPFTPPLEFVEERTVEREDVALFADTTLRGAERWSLTAGLRAQRDRSTDASTQFWFLDAREVLVDDAVTGRLGLDLRLTDDHLFYASLSTGWKNGGSNPGALSGALDVPATFAPEEVTALEVGSRNRFAGGRARLDLTAFAYDYRNYQYLQEDPVPFAAGTGNIPRVSIHGVELDARWQLAPAWRLSGQLSALDGRIDSSHLTLDPADFRASGFGRFTPTAIEDRASLRVDLRGNTPPKLTDATSRIALDWAHYAANSEWTATLAHIHRGAFWYRVYNHAIVDRVPAWDSLDLRLGWQPAERPWSLDLRATNLLDEAGVNSRFTNPFGLHTTSDELIPPRQVVASVRYRF